ncbi:MAG: SAM-dependent methyltransferase [Verrucomicrobia bacterium]|nr:SAM-dependent methyltransferase [Verrucomicrobiota bacterium]
MTEIPFRSAPISNKKIGKKTVASFDIVDGNIDQETVESFGDEWLKFNAFSEADIQGAGDQYFDIVSPKMLNKESTVLDLGCGSGRWTKYIAPRAGFIEAVDPSDAVFQAAHVWNDLENVRFTQASVDSLPFPDRSFDFVMSLGVLHHIPDTAQAIKTALKKLKPNGYALIYLYYALDNRGFLFKIIFRLSGLFRTVVSKMPKSLKHLICDLLAVFIYLPFIYVGKLTKALIPGNAYLKVPLAYYRNKSWNIIRNDALDRFGTPLEQRFKRHEIEEMLKSANMKNIIFSEGEPYWHVVAQKKAIDA